MAKTPEHGDKGPLDKDKGHVPPPISPPPAPVKPAASPPLPKDEKGNRLWLCSHPAFPEQVPLVLPEGSTAEDAADTLVRATGLKSKDPVVVVDGGPAPGPVPGPPPSPK